MLRFTWAPRKTRDSAVLHFNKVSVCNSSYYCNFSGFGNECNIPKFCILNAFLLRPN